MKKQAMNKRYWLKTLLIVMACCYLGKSAIAQTIIIATKSNSLIFKVDRNNHLQQAWFGEKLQSSQAADTSMYKDLPAFNPAFPSGGMGYVFEPAIQVTHADGNPSLDLNYIESSVEKENEDVSITHIQLKDAVYPFYVTLHFKACKNENVVFGPPLNGGGLLFS